MQPYLYLGNFGRKPHHIYTVNKTKVPIGHGQPLQMVTGRHASSRWHSAAQGKRRDAAASSSAQAAQSILKLPQNLRHMVSQYNATAQNFFEAERLQQLLQKAKTLLAVQHVQLEGVDVKRSVTGKGKNAKHLIEFTFNSAWAKSLPTKTYSKFLQSIIPQHQL